MALPSLACLPAQRFLGCFHGVSLVHGPGELLLSPLHTDLLWRLHSHLPPCGEGFAILLQPPKAHYQALQCWLGELVWLPSHQGQTCVAVWVIVDAGTLASSGGLGRPLVLEPAPPL